MPIKCCRDIKIYKVHFCCVSPKIDQFIYTLNKNFDAHSDTFTNDIFTGKIAANARKEKAKKRGMK